MDGSEWIRARSECSHVQAFERLKTEVRDDVEANNKLIRAGGASSGLFVIQFFDRSFRVYLDLANIDRAVVFSLQSDFSIAVDGTNPPVAIRGTVVLDDDGKCRLRVNDQELKFWQFRRRALEALFFGF